MLFCVAGLPGCGAVTSVRFPKVKKHKPSFIMYAHVEFASEEGAANALALHGSSLLGGIVECRLAAPFAPTKGKGEGSLAWSARLLGVLACLECSLAWSVFHAVDFAAVHWRSGPLL